MYDTFLLKGSDIFSDKRSGAVFTTGYSNSIDNTRLYSSLQLFVDAQSPTSFPRVPLENDPPVQGLIHDQRVTFVFH